MSALKPSSRRFSQSAFLTSLSNLRNGFYRDTEVVVYAVTTTGLWFIPLLNRLHVESMAVLSFVAFFAGGRAALKAFQDKSESSPVAVVAGRIIRLFVPFIMLSISALWAPNCDYLRGASFFFLFPILTVVFATGVASAISAHGRKYRDLVVIGLVISVLGPLFDIGLHPQFYSYNHVFGGVLGPLYDEELVMRPGLFWFRLLTLLWAILLFHIGWLKRKAGRLGLRAVLLVLAIGLMYIFSPTLGLNTTEWLIQQSLSGHRQTEHFDIYYDPAEIDSIEIDLWAVEHEFRYTQLRERLDTDVSGRIKSFIYPDADERAGLTGARVTSIAPVWLKTPQVHVLASELEQVFPHELAHIFSREFGLPVIRASMSVGLVEGFAEATEPPLGRPSNHDMVASSDLFRHLTVEEFSERLSNTLSVFGFWSGRSTVSYTVSGSFVEYLLDTYGPAPLKGAYATGDFEGAYKKPISQLSQEWIAFLKALPAIDKSAAWRANLLFAMPSLFEQNCPHWTPRRVRTFRKAITLMDRDEHDQAYELLSDLIERHPEYSAAWPVWGREAMNQGDASLVLDRLSELRPDTLGISERSTRAQTLAVLGEGEAARSEYLSLVDEYPAYARETRAITLLRAETANDPDIVAVLIANDSLHVRREILESILVDKEIGTSRVSEAGYLWRSRMLAAEHKYADALSNLETIISVSSGLCDITQNRELGLRCTAWAANYAYRSGDLETAAALSERAISAHELAGDFSMVRALEDLSDRIAWVRSRHQVAD